jgi:hypothetical protein
MNRITTFYKIQSITVPVSVIGANLNNFQNNDAKKTFYSGLLYIAYKYTQIYFANEKLDTKH